MNIFVGNLSFDTTEDKLQRVFEEFGPVKSVKVVVDGFTKRPRGFAFVEMAERAHGEMAVEKLNNTSLDTRNIVVNEARPKTDRDDRGGFDRRSNNGFDRRNDRKFDKRY